MKVRGSSKIRLFLFVLTAFALSAFLLIAGAAASNWSILVVHTHTQAGADLNEYGTDTSLDFDGIDHPHISYYSEFDDEHGPHGLKYATLEAGGWRVEAVDMVGEAGKDTSINADGTVSISYYDEGNGDLKFAQRIGGVWTKEVADNGGGSSRSSSTDVGEDTSLKMDASGKAHISYYNDTGNDLKYAVFVGDGLGNCGGPAKRWQCMTVDSTGDVGKYTSLALDSTGKAHISYYDHTNGNLKYAHEVGTGGNCGGGKFECATIDSSSHDVGEHSSLALLANLPQIAYEDESSGALLYVCMDPSGIWTAPQVVTNTGHEGEDTSLAIGSDGLPRISYHNETNETLNLATRTDVCGQPGTWQIQVIDNGGPHHHHVGEDNSLALKSDNTACVSYHDEDNGDLKYACVASSPPPVVTAVQPSGWITSTSTTVGADYVDNSGTGIDTAAVAVYMDGSKLTGCTATGTHVSCSASGLAQGNHAITVNVKDNNGNFGTGAGSFGVDSIAPVVTSVLPAGTVSGSSAAITVYYSDSGSGINTGSAIVTLDGNLVAGCSATATGVTCPVTGLAPGLHAIGGSVADIAGNTSTFSGSFNVSAPCTPQKPALALVCPLPSQAFWGSYLEYVARDLSVTLTVYNNGAGTAHNVQITGSGSTQGVTMTTALPYGVGDIAGVSSKTFTVHYHVPSGVTEFRTDTFGGAQDECGTTYTYPV